MRWILILSMVVALAGCEDTGRQRMPQSMPPPRINPASLDLPKNGNLQEKVAEQEAEITDLKHQLQVLREEVLRAKGKSAGLVEWVDLDLKSAMINLGSSDGLDVDNQFAVYGSDADLKDPRSRRGILKVTKIVGPHLSETDVVEAHAELTVREGDRVYELSATGVGAREPQKSASVTPNLQPRKAANDDTLKQLESAFDDGRPLKSVKPPANP